MKSEVFNEIVNECCEQIQKILVLKGKEYATGDDRLHNFRTAARKHGKGQTLAQALTGMDMKHIVSIDDMVSDGLPAMLRTDAQKRAYIDEKIGDHLNYTILLKACLLEQFNLIG